MASDETTRQLQQAQYLRQYYADTGREYSTGKNVKCPNAAAHAHGDANASARIYENADGAIVKCYGCGCTWDIFELWKMDNGGTFADAKAALRERYGTGCAVACRSSGGTTGREVHALTGGQADAPRQKKPDAATQAYIDRCAVAYQSGADEAGRAYMRGRGISDGTAARFKIGYDAERQAVIIPHGAGYMARSIKPDAEQREKCRYYPKGAPRVLFNGAAMVQAAKDNTPVFIVEGEIDALSIAECGGVAISTGGTSGTGKAIKAAQIIGRGVYVPCMDRDNAGENAQAKLVDKLREIGGAVHVYADAPLILLPDSEDGTHPKDANEALQRDAAALRACVADVIGKARACAEAEEAKPYITLADIPEPQAEEANPRALFRRGYLRKGGGLIVASVAGAGKSTFSLQCALHWVMGKACFGVDPVRPLRVAIIQAEDDAEELAMFRASMKQGLTAEGFTAVQTAEALRRLHIRTDFLGKTGAGFADTLRAMQSEREGKYDLVIVNPLNSYFDGDISLNKDATEFFRTMIDPVIKNPATECGIMFIHHMGKPAKGKDAANWGKGAYAQYAMQGAAELNNWARAVLIIVPFDNAPDFWTITAAKRYKPLAWKDADGNDTKEKVIAYSKGYVYWREPDADEIKAAKNGTKPTRETEEERKRREEAELKQATAEIVNYLQRIPRPIRKTDLFNWCAKNESAVFKGFRSHTVKKPDGGNFPKRPSFLAYELVAGNPISYGVAYHVGKYKNGKQYELYGGVYGGGEVHATTGDTPTAQQANARAGSSDDEKSIEEIIAEQDADDFWTDATGADGNE